MAITTGMGREADAPAAAPSPDEVQAAIEQEQGIQQDEIKVKETSPAEELTTATREARKVTIDASDTSEAFEALETAEEEAPKEEAPEEEEQPQAAAEETTDDSPQDQQLHQAWEKFGEEVRAFRDERKRWERDKTNVQGLEDVAKLAKENPLAALTKLGVDSDALIGALAESQKPESKEAHLQKQVEQLSRWKQESETAKQQAEINRQNEEIKDMAMDVAKAGGEKFELVTTVPEARDLVWEVINKYFDETGEAPPLETAVAHVEKYLEKQGEMYLGTKRFGTRAKPRNPMKNGKSKEPGTLTAEMTTGAPPVDMGRLAMDPDIRLAQIKKKYGW